MPFIVPSSSRSDAVENSNNHIEFTHTNSGDTAEDAILLTGSLTECNKISLMVDLYDAYVAFDGTASSSKLFIPAGTGYSDVNVKIITKISVINASAGKNARIRGVLWGQ